jgi:hypothetical protein
VANAAEIAADDEEDGEAKLGHPVEHRALRIERDHDSPDAFDEQDAAMRCDVLAREGDERVEFDAAAFAGRGDIRRQWSAKAKGRNARDVACCHG